MEPPALRRRPYRACAAAGAHLDRLVVSDSAWPVAGSPGPGSGQLEVLGCTGLYAQAIRCIHEGGSIAEPIGG